MPDQKTQNQRVEKYIKELFQNLEEEDYYDLLAEAILYLSQESDQSSSAKEPSGKLFDSLEKHLSKYWQEKQKEISTRYMLGKSLVVSASSLRTELNEGLSDEELLSAKSRHIKEPPEDGHDQETILAYFELHKEEWRKDLPLIEFEVLEILVSEGRKHIPRLTLGIDSMGLQMLFRRARIRIMWSDRLES
jgi:hypothetical protein